MSREKKNSNSIINKLISSDFDTIDRNYIHNRKILLKREGEIGENERELKDRQVSNLFDEEVLLVRIIIRQFEFIRSLWSPQ